MYRIILLNRTDMTIYDNHNSDDHVGYELAAHWPESHVMNPGSTTTPSPIHPTPTTQMSHVTPLYGYGLIESIAIVTILSAFIVFAMAGNILVVVAILTDRHLRKTSNFFIISLAVADALVALLVMTFSVVNEVLGRWIFGEIFCDVWISFDVMCSTASIMNLCAISLDRYVHIRNPLHYDLWVTRSRTLIAIAAVWILSALISFLPIHLDWHRLGRTDSQEPSTDDDPFFMDHQIFMCTLDLNPLYAVLSSSVSFYLPCIMMISIYVKLYRYAKLHVKSIRENQRTFKNDLTSSTSGSDTKTSDHKAAVTLGIIMGVFLFCWAPFFTVNIIGACCNQCVPPIAFSAFTWLGYLNSTMNPVIYSIFNQEFCQAFKRVLLTGRRCVTGRYGGDGDDLTNQRSAEYNSLRRRTERIQLTQTQTTATATPPAAPPPPPSQEDHELTQRESVRLVGGEKDRPIYL